MEQPVRAPRVHRMLSCAPKRAMSLSSLVETRPSSAPLGCDSDSEQQAPQSPATPVTSRLPPAALGCGVAPKPAVRSGRRLANSGIIDLRIKFYRRANAGTRSSASPTMCARNVAHVGDAVGLGVVGLARLYVLCVACVVSLCVDAVAVALRKRANVPLEDEDSVRFVELDTTLDSPSCFVSPLSLDTPMAPPYPPDNNNFDLAASSSSSSSSPPSDDESGEFELHIQDRK
eukprot:m51a1_g4779 hypothetical protein (231) ;mRNA; r:43586-44595